MPRRSFALWFVVLVGGLVSAVAGLADPPPAPTGKVLPIEGKVLEIVGVSRGLDAVLRDLDARVTADEIRVELSADVLFDFDSATLRPESRESLSEIASIISAYPGQPVTIEGHTDSKGADDYNQTLSERRAESVKTWLVQKGGITASRITTRGLGERQPKVANQRDDGSDDPEGRRQNRRVEITIRKS